ncbi:MAG: hypothetical protein Q9193_001444 [Seirophora villosa]
MSTSLDSVQCAWRQIRQILEDWAQSDMNDNALDADQELLAQLHRSLEGGSLVISALNNDLQPYLSKPPSPHVNLGFKRRTRFVWNENAFRDHQDRIRDQVNSMTLLLSVLQLRHLVEGHDILQRSDDSAYALALTSVQSCRDSRSLHSLDDETPLVYQKLSIDKDLFSADVYKKNILASFLRSLFPSKKPTLPGPGESILSFSTDKTPTPASTAADLPPVRANCQPSDKDLVWRAIWTNDYDKLTLVLKDTPINVDARYDSGGQAVHLACLRGSLQCLGVLIEAGADLEAVDDMGLSALRYLAINIPPEAAFLAWVPLSMGEREGALRAMLSQSSNFFPTPDEGLAGRRPYDRAIQIITKYLVDQLGLRYLPDSRPSFSLDSYALTCFEQYLPERLRTPQVMVSLEIILRGAHGREKASIVEKASHMVFQAAAR